MAMAYNKMIQTKKILFYGSFTGGGTERITYNLASALAEKKQHDIYVMNTRPKMPRFNLSPKVTYCCLGNETRRHRSIIGTIFGVRRFIKNHDFDIVVSIEALPGIVLIPATFGLKCRTIVWEHANYYQTQGSRWTRIIRKIWLKIASRYVVLTKRDKNNFETHEHPRCPIVQIYNPVAITRSGAYNSASTQIMSAGHLVSIKQFHLIPQIFASIASKYPKWTWHIYGEGPERAHIEAEIAKYGLQNRVLLEGAFSEIDSIYARSSIYVLTSRQEGLPTVLIEAQMHGLPAVSFDIETGPDEIIIPDVTGFLIKPYDTESMSMKIEELIEGEQLRRDLSSETTRLFEKFSFQSSVEQWQQLI